MGLARERSLIRYNELDKTYHIHNLLLDYISKKEDRRCVDAKEIYRRAGEWYLGQGQHSQAFDFLNRAGATEAILAELDLEDMPELLFVPFQQFHKMFEDNSLCLKHPIAYLRCVYAAALSGPPGAAAQCWDFMMRIENCVQCATLEENHKNFLLGEVNALWAVITFNDMAKILIHSRKALSYFSGGCSQVVTRNKAFAYGSPHLLYLYYRESGGLRDVRDIFVANRYIFASDVSGYGIGCDSVAEAEYALETGAWDQVELHAYKAIYKARSAGQTNLLVCANFTLARLALLRGDRGECLALMEALRKTLLNKNNPVLNTAFDMCMAYLSGCMAKADGFPAWLSDGDWTGGYFYSQSQSFRAVVRGMALLREDPIRLVAYCETAAPEFQRYNNLLGMLHNAIHEAVARNALHGKEAGLPALSAALSIGCADHVVAPFVEKAPHILAMLEVLSQRGGKPEESFSPSMNGQRPDAFLNEILDLCRRYTAGRNAGALDAVSLTVREIEILKLLESGCKHADIGMRLYISITTVRYHIQNIYQKLEVNNKTLAIRKAKDLGLI
jgi:LuxR family maltose regulon positive regulatory protein